MTAAYGPQVDRWQVRALVAIDDIDRRDRVCDVLARADVEAIGTHGADLALATIREARPDLLITDLVHPDGTIEEPLLQLLEIGTPPTLVIAENEVAGVQSLEAGAADYVVEPFLERELRARALLRSRRRVEPVLERGELVIDGVSRRVSARGEQVDLSPREYDLLEYLAHRPQHAFTRKQLLEAVWGASTGYKPDTVTEHIYRLRQKIEKDPNRPQLLVTVRGVGYRFAG